MSGGVPLPTFIPQAAWDQLTIGNIEVSVANSVPNSSYLSYNASEQQLGLVGPQDGCVVYLAGLTSDLDGGQKWLMWVAASMLTPDGANVFCPFATTSTPGRWINTLSSANPSTTITTQSFAAGSTGTIASQSAPINYVYITAGSGTTALTMPSSTYAGQTFTIKDTIGIAGTSKITINGSIDGQSSLQIEMNYGSATLSWNGSGWSQIS